jgi:SAM-dependent methyltransferase
MGVAVSGQQDEVSAGNSAWSRVDMSVPHPARRYDYWLGGKDNFAVDRESGDAIAAAYPAIRTAALENRRFLHRAVRFLAEEAGVRQFLDIGTGIPTSPNVHEIAQAVAPSSRIVYADNDPIVLAHARALLTSAPEGVTAYLDADLREPDRILGDPELRGTLDLTRPVALMLVAVLHFVLDDRDPYGIVNQLVDALAPGSYLVLSHVTYDFLPPATIAELNATNAARRVEFRPRTRAEFERFLDGLELVPPGIASVAHWRADDAPQPRPSAEEVGTYCAIARIP